MKAILFVCVISIILLLAGCSTDSRKYDGFASCLTEKGAMMYGAYWCPHCQDQKKMFGKSWEYVNYIECSLPNAQGQTELCSMEKIESYPTWEFADGERNTGVMSLNALAEKTDCPLP